MDGLPNIELVSLLILLYTLEFPALALPAVYTYVVVYGLLNGFGVWWFAQLYIWLPLMAAARLLRGSRSPLLWALVSGLYGLLYGALYAVGYALLNGGMGYLPIEPTARELEKAAAVAALHEKVALSEMTLHEFIAGDPERQRTLFANGISVEVDFRHNTWRIEQTNDVEVR